MQTAIPYPELTRRYVDLKQATSAKRLEHAEGATVCEYAALVADSVEHFSRFDVSPAEPFYPKNDERDRGKNTKSLSRTYGWAMALKKTGTVAVEGDRSLDFTYVAREVAPTHTKPRRPFEVSAGRVNTTDLILANATSGRPIVAELKLARDKDPFTGLVQALAAAAQLVPARQRKRLVRLGKEASDGKPRRRIADGASEPLIDVYVLLGDFPPRNRDRWLQLAYACGLATGLEMHPIVQQFFARIVLLSVIRSKGDQVSASIQLPRPPAATAA